MSKIKLEVLSPSGKKPMVYNLLLDDEDEYEEIVKTIKFVCESFPTIQESLSKDLENCLNTPSIKSLQELCDRYNRLIKCILHIEGGTSIRSQIEPTACPSPALLRHILELTYNESIKNPNELNKYQPFSSEVYGELSYDFIKHMIEKTQITSNDVFIDLGSGVGQVVLQVAATAQCKMCYGIEIDKKRSKYAKTMSDNFEDYLAWFGKSCGEYKLINGDFLNNRHRKLIKESTVILVNNLCLGPTIDNKLKEIFLHLNNGTKLISSKSFGPLNRSINDRNYKDIIAILDITKIYSPMESSSWTSKSIPYYLHVINYSKIDHFWDNIQKPIFKRKLISQIQKRYKMRKMICSACKNNILNNDQKETSDSELNNTNEIAVNTDESMCDVEKLKTFESSVDALINNFKTQFEHLLGKIKGINYENIAADWENNVWNKNVQIKNEIRSLEEKVDLLSEESANLLKLRLTEMNRLKELSLNDSFRISNELIEVRQRLLLAKNTLDLERNRLKIEHRKLENEVMK